MSDPDFDLLRSDKAIVAHRHVAGKMGGTTVWCVVLTDGFILECGDVYGEARARTIASMINASGPHHLTKQNLIDFDHAY